MKTTKQLARELGIIRKRGLTNSSNKQTTTRQPFSYLVVLDFESTCWQDGKFRTQEIIEFPAVLLNTTTGKVESEFQFYVQPQEQPTLSEFCKQLTGITQEQVDNGIPLHICLRKFVRWLDMLKESKSISFTQTTSSHLATFVTWSDWDLGVCLFNELRRKQIARPAALNSWIDLRATYRKFYSRKPNGLNGALKDLGIDFEGREHSGLHDSRNTAVLAYRMIKDGCIMNITKSLKGSAQSSHEKFLPTKPVKLTPSKSPLHKRKKPCDDIIPCDLDLNDSLDHAISSSQELDNLLNDLETPTPERKRKVRKPNMTVSSSRSEVIVETCQKLTKVKAKRTMPGKFDSSKIFVDPVDQTSNFQSSRCASQKLSEVSTNVPITPKKGSKTPSKDRSKPSCPPVVKTPTYNTFTSGSSSMGVGQCKANMTGHGKMKFNSSPKPLHVNSTVTKDGKHSPRKNGSPELNSKGYKTITESTSNKFKTPSSSPSLRSVSSTKVGLCGQFKTPSPPNSALKTPCIDPGFKTPCTTVPSRNSVGLGSKSSYSHRQSTTPASNCFLRTPSVTTKTNSSASSSMFRTPTATQATIIQTPSNGSWQLSVNSSGMKGTPPLCKCGKRSKRRTAQTPGPNLGRTFFTCGASSYNHCTGERKGCGFFKWEVPAGNSGRSHSFTKNGTLSKPYIPVFNNSTSVYSAQKKSLGVRTNSISSFR